jgi:hypothetical protein
MGSRARMPVLPQSLGVLVASAAASATAATISTAAASTTTPAISATTTAAAAAVAASATAAASSATRPILTRLGLVHRQRPPGIVLPIERRDRGLRLGIRTHLDESKSLRPPGVPIRNHFRAGDRPMRLKKSLKIRAGHVIAQVPHIQLAAHKFSPLENGPIDLWIYFSGRC